MNTKVWDIQQPTDNWSRGYAHLEYLRIGLLQLLAKNIKVHFDE